jgi:hypothetical protein
LLRRAELDLVLGRVDSALGVRRARLGYGGGLADIDVQIDHARPNSEGLFLAWGAVERWMSMLRTSLMWKQH